MRRTSEHDLLEYHRTEARLAANPRACAAIRAEVLSAIEAFLAAFEIEAAGDPRKEAALTGARKAAASIGEKPLEWFASQHEWNRGEARGALSADVCGAGILVRFEMEHLGLIPPKDSFRFRAGAK